MTTLTTTDRESLRDDLYEAQEHLNEAIRLLDNYVRATGDAAAEAYILDHLRIFAGRNHGFLSNDLNLDDLIERLDERDDEVDDASESADSAALHIRTAAGHNLYYAPSLGRYVTIPADED